MPKAGLPVHLLPPAVYLPPVLIGIAVNFLVGGPFVPTWMALGAGVPLLVAGAAFGLWALQTMLSHGESPEPSRPTNRVVTAGPFAYSRNPVYLGFEVAALGAGFLMNSVPVLVSVPISLVLTQVLVIYPEERYLAGRFSDDYGAYRRRVRRWL